MHILIIILYFITSTPSLSSLFPARENGSAVTHLKPGDHVQVVGERSALGYDTKTLNIFCCSVQPKVIDRYFSTVNLRVIRDDGHAVDYVHYKGSSPAAVQQDIENKKSFFSFNFLFSNNDDRIPINPFNRTCVGIETMGHYQVVLHLIRVDVVRVALFAAGVLLLFAACKLSDNAIFYYICGVSIGMCASLLVVIYMLSKVLPRRPMMYGAMLGGWGLVFYFGQMFWQNLQMILVTYQDYVVYYCLTTGFISFVICYRYGPPTDQRSKQLIKWTLQGAALLLIYNSSDLVEFSIGIVCLLLAVAYFPSRVFDWVGRFVGRQFPQKPRLLTVQEYEQQGAVETAKALEELKRYCSSPNCKQWSTVMKLKNPSRFASFMEGESHLLDSEILDYECSDLNISSDNDDNDNDDRGAGGERFTDDEGEMVLVPKKLLVHQSTPRSNGSLQQRRLTQSTSRRQTSRRYNVSELNEDD